TQVRRSSIEVGGIIQENTVWNADTVKVTADVQIMDQIKLSISPGVQVEFQGYYQLQVDGCLEASGSPEAFIRFTSANPELFQPDSSLTGCWQGIRYSGTSAVNDSSLFQYCVFECSKTLDEYDPGGVFGLFNFSKIAIRNCIFQDNLGTYGGVLSCRYNSNPIFCNNLVYGNYALISGSVLYSSYSYPKVINNTIINNQMLNEEFFWATAAIHNFISKPLIWNNIIRDNYTAYFEYFQLLENKQYYTVCNNIEDAEEGNGNIDLDPLFLLAGSDPYSLLPVSPCIDSGTLHPEYSSTTDLKGNPRLFGAEVDMGAYEWQETSWGNDVWSVGNSFTNYPNPFNPSGAGRSLMTTISFVTQVQAEKTEISIFNLKGQQVKELVNEVLEAGSHTVTWDGKDENGKSAPSGIYFCRMKSGDFVQNRKMMLIK
ncbi:MAG: T9SS type A sorting domain-containing protein, partial [Candidatus Cloacimonetes bacterium]|nr:T9SS type A sorting domain-containing protein [Candidatus Cloacimonadota bacterium]